MKFHLYFLPDCAWLVIIIIINMIKISSLISLGKFSTIRFPEYYNKVFQLNNQIRSCITLTDLQTFVHEHDEDIKKYAKVSIL